MALDLFLAAAVRVAHPQRLDGGDFARQTRRTQAGDQHGGPGKQGGTDKDHGACGNYRRPLHAAHQHRYQNRPQQPAQNEAHWDADDAQAVGLIVNQLFELPGGGAQGFQFAVKLHVGGNADLEDVVDNQVARDEHKSHSQVHRQVFLRSDRAHLRRVGQVDAVFQLAEPGVRKDALHRLLDVLVAVEVYLHHVEAEDLIWVGGEDAAGHLVGIHAADPRH